MAECTRAEIPVAHLSFAPALSAGAMELLMRGLFAWGAQGIYRLLKFAASNVGR